MNPVAFYDALNCILRAAEAGSRPGAAGAQLRALDEASAAAPAAFPAGSPEAEALSMLLAMDSAVVRDFADCLSLAVILRESGDTLAAETARAGASDAALTAFMIGCRESRALSVLLAAAEKVPEAVL